MIYISPELFRDCESGEYKITILLKVINNLPMEVKREIVERAVQNILDDEFGVDMIELPTHVSKGKYCEICMKRGLRVRTHQ